MNPFTDEMQVKDETVEGAVSEARNGVDAVESVK
jgi:hypothetical protein